MYCTQYPGHDVDLKLDLYLQLPNDQTVDVGRNVLTLPAPPRGAATQNSGPGQAAPSTTN